MRLAHSPTAATRLLIKTDILRILSVNQQQQYSNTNYLQYNTEYYSPTLNNSQYNMYMWRLIFFERMEDNFGRKLVSLYTIFWRYKDCMSVWSRGMIPASGAGGPGFDSRYGPFCSLLPTYVLKQSSG